MRSGAAFAATKNLLLTMVHAHGISQVLCMHFVTVNPGTNTPDGSQPLFATCVAYKTP